MKQAKLMFMVLTGILLLASCDKKNSNSNLSNSQSTPISESTSKNKEVVYVVTFETNGGVMDTYQIEVKQGGKLTLPKDPIKENHTFIGWFYDRELTLPFDLNKTIESNLTLYAKYVSIDESIEIKTLNDLKNIELNKNYKLMNDIDCGGKELVSLGTYENPYSGHFYGNGYTIKNFTLAKSTYNGLFGYVTGIIEKLNINNHLIVNNDTTTYTGLIAAYVYGGKVISCSTSGSIVQNVDAKYLSSYVGGVVGRNEIGVIDKCYSNVDISNINTGYAYTGGVLAYNGGGDAMQAVIINSYAVDGILSTSSTTDYSAYTGGLVGFNFGTVKQSFTLGQKISAKSDEYQCFAGGVVGDNNGGKVTNLFSTSSVSITSDNASTFRGAVIGRNFKSSLDEGSGTMENCYAYQGQEVKVYTKEANRLSSRHEQVVTPSVSSDDLSLKDWYLNNLHFDNAFLIKNGYFPSLTSSFRKVNLSKPLGSEANPITITSSDDLLNIEYDKSYILKNDINLNGISIDPIGTYEKPYSGVFNGNGYKITNLVMNTNSTLGYTALFGYLNGSIKNLEVNSSINFDTTSSLPQYVSSLVAYSVKSYIANIDITTIIDANGKGVISGALVGYSQESIIENSSSNSTISIKTTNPSSYVGGAVGVLKGGKINQVSSSGTLKVDGENYSICGGLIGRNEGEVLSSYAISEITLTEAKIQKIAGGLIGANLKGKVKDSYSKAIINSTKSSELNLLGGLCGWNELAVENCYYHVNEEIKYSFGHSLLINDVTRVSLEDLKTLAASLNEYFYDESTKGYPCLIGEKEA